jgi:hypothetical protein
MLLTIVQGDALTELRKLNFNSMDWPVGVGLMLSAGRVASGSSGSSRESGQG